MEHLCKLVGSHLLNCLGSLEQIPKKGKSLPSIGLTGSDRQALTCENEIGNSKDALGTGVIHGQKGPGYLWAASLLTPPPSSPVTAAPAPSPVLAYVADVPQC